MKIIILIVLVHLSYIVSAQDEYKGTKSTPFKVDPPKQEKNDSIDPQPELPPKQLSEFKKNIRIGGAFNLGTTSTQTGLQLFYVQASPQLTYVLSKNFEGGLSTSYAYTGTFNNINVHSISLGPIMRAYILDQFFLQIEGSANYFTQSQTGYLPYTATLFNAFAGGGFISRLSATSYILTGVKVNLIANQLTQNYHIPVAFTSIHFGLW
jgi:hypothetical protein